MKTKKLNNLTFGGEILSRAQLKEVFGGKEQTDNSCGGLDGLVCDWTCTTPFQSIHLGEMTCFEAQEACPFNGDTFGGNCSGGVE